MELLGTAAFALVVCVFVATFAAPATQRFALRSSNVAAVVSSVLTGLANQDRAQNGLAALTVNPLLTAAAQDKANDMAAKGYFAHVSPQGVDPWHWFGVAGYSFTYAGENLAVDFSDSGDVNTAWMNSPEHRKNILDPHYTEIGIATAEGMYQGHPTVFVVQEFGSPASTKVQAPVTKANVPSEPTSIATASTDKGSTAGASSKVLGSSAPAPETASGVTEQPTKTVEAAQPASGQVPLWGYLVSYPRETLQFAYYALGLFILLALGFDTGFELHRRHARRAALAGGFLIVAFLLFFVSSYMLFAAPVLAATLAAL